MRASKPCSVILFLMFASACGGSTTPSPAASVFGSWTGASGSSFTRATIQSQGDQLVAHLWAMCVPECDWGTSSIPLSAVANNSFALTWNQDFVIRTQQIDLESDGRLRIVMHSHYIDNSGRADLDTFDFLVKN